MFISNLAGRCQTFQKLMRKREKFVWDEAYQDVFDNNKEWMLGASVPRSY